jgi:xylan 1,4-beta-xylosidase
MKLEELDQPSVGKKWREELSLFLVLWGDIELLADGKRSLLKNDDIIVINPNVIYEIFANDYCVLALYMDITRLDKVPSFDCDSSTTADKSAFYVLKHLMALFLKENANKQNNDFINMGIAFRILSELQRFFPVKDSGISDKTAHNKKLYKVIDYINEHYREGISLKELSYSQNFSVPYFSKFFKQHFGVGFASYYNNLRLEQSVSELLSTESPIETIALNNGFSDTRSFVTLFKKRYGTIPSIYRKEKAVPKNEPHINEFESKLHDLAKYLTVSTKVLLTDSPLSSGVKSLKLGKISILGGNVLKHTFRTFITVGRAKELLYADVQKMLTELQNEIGYKYIKFHSILSDDMLLYGENERGEAIYSFVLIDKAVDFLLSIGLKPLVQLSFMPKQLALDKFPTSFSAMFNVSMPKDMNKWEDMIKAVTGHFIERYGLNEIEQWLFCVWNEPNLPYWNDYGNEIFFTLYKATWEAVKSVNKKLVFGMPSVAYYSEARSWIKDFYDLCRQHGCMPDFCNIHYYDNDLSSEDIEEIFNKTKLSLTKGVNLIFPNAKLNTDENSFRKAIADLHAIFTDAGAGNVPIYMTEWNMTVSHRNLLNDTCFKACYLAKNILENYDALDSFGYWTLTDFIEETQPSNEHFHGGLGLLTHSGIKKANYHVFSFINRLGDCLIARGEGFFITKSCKNIQIILYNYEHFSHLFASGELFGISFKKRYAPFSKLDKLTVSLALTDLPAKECKVREYILNMKHGSAFDTWIEMGATALSAEDVEYLKQVSMPKLYVHDEKISNEALDLTVELEPLEVRLIEITL